MKLIKVTDKERVLVIFHSEYVEVRTLSTGRTLNERTRYTVLGKTRGELYDHYVSLGFISEDEIE